MAYIILLNLQVIFFLIYFFVEYFKKIFICHFVMNNIIVYHTIIILNILNKMVNYIKLKIVKNWLI